MSFSSLTSRMNYTGNGNTATYSYSFLIFSKADLRVTRRDTSGVETPLVVDTDFTVSAAGINNPNGGTITLTAGNLPNGFRLAIRRVTNLKQETDIRNQGDFYPETHEDAFDKAMMIDQQQQDEIDRAVRLPETVQISEFDPRLPADIVASGAGKVPLLNSGGNGFAPASTWPTANAINTAQGNANDAAASATAAAASATSASSSQTSATSSASSAASSASSASTSATNAASSATAAGNSATAAGNSATAAGNSATAAGNSATAAATSATNAQSSATAAATSATNAGNSATAAATSATNAANSATAASGSATTAATHASNATALIEFASDAAYETAKGSAASQSDIYYNTTSGKIRFFNGSAWADVGSGSGSGGVNYITNTDSETDTGGWATYSDAAGVTPVDGTGGTANITWTRTTVSPLRGNASFILTKDAVNRQGQGASFAYTLARADFARVLTVSFDYEVVSGTYADGDLRVYIVADVAGTPTVIEPTGTRILNNIGPARHTCTFQTHASATAYRLVIHCASVSASAYVVEFENIVCGPQAQAIGAFVGDWQLYTPTVSPISGYTLAPFGYWRRVGDSVQIQAAFQKNGSVGVGAGDLTFSLPPGQAIDYNKVSGFGNSLLGSASGFVSGIGHLDAQAVGLTSSNTVAIMRGNNGGYWVGTDVAANSYWTVNFTVPIVGWSSGQVLSSETDTRVCVASLAGNPSNSITASTYQKSTWSTSPVQYDTHGAWDTANSRFIIPVTGFYRMSWSVEVQATYSSGQAVIARIRNTTQGVNIEGANRVIAAVTTSLCATATGNMFCRAGDVVELFVFCSGGTPTWNAGIQGQLFCMERISGPASIAASETIAFRASTSAGQSIANNSASALCVFGTEAFDTHGAYDASTGLFTAPSPGIYTISASTTFTANATGERACYVAVNGSLVFNFGKRSGVASFQIACNGSITTRLNTGDTVSIRPFQTSGGDLSLSANPDENFFSIVRNGI